jgi:hypothetical protein
MICLLTLTLELATLRMLHSLEEDWNKQLPFATIFLVAKDICYLKLFDCIKLVANVNKINSQQIFHHSYIIVFHILYYHKNQQLT